MMSDNLFEIADQADSWESLPSSYENRDGEDARNIGHPPLRDYHFQSGLELFGAGGAPHPPRPSPARSFQLAIKRLADIFGSLTLLIVLAPVLAGLALLIKFSSSGPVLFRQERVGLNGVSFRIFKFRTMYSERCDITGVAQTVVADSRVTSIGRLMRQKSLDELPQLINVLTGEMSLVGPRPHVAGQLAAGVPCESVIPYYAMRHFAKPGITGWAQVNGYRGPTDTIGKARRRVDHDLAYIQNFSIFLDGKILILTLIKEFVTGTGS